MNTNALSIANWFVDKSKEDSTAPHSLTLLRLVKLVYIAYGFGLAILDRNLIDARFDKVEAWKYGPVIPSVYHSFKYCKNNVITDRTSVLDINEFGEPSFIEPSIESHDADVSKLLDFVWSRYRGLSTDGLVDLLHQEGTPWWAYYVPEKNVEIPEEVTKLFYQDVVSKILSHAKK